MVSQDVSDEGDGAVAIGFKISSRTSSLEGSSDGVNNFQASETTALLRKGKEGDKRDEGRCYVQKRYILLVMLFGGMAITSISRINVSITMPAMTNVTFTENTDGAGNESGSFCRAMNETTSNHDDEPEGEFLWSTHEQELILSGFFYGYGVCQIPMGWLTDKIGGSPVFVTSLLLSGVLNTLGPVAAQSGPMVLMTVRILCGVTECEHSWFYSTVLSGFKFGAFVGTIASGFLAGSSFLGGWPSTFYVFGENDIDKIVALRGFGVAWSLLWLLLIYNTPQSHPRISNNELHHIESNAVSSSVTIPVKAVLLSKPVWAVLICTLVGSFSVMMVFTNFPLFLKHVHGYNIEEIGYLFAIPYVVEGLSLIVSGFTGNQLIARRMLSITATRKLMTGLGLILSALAFIALVFADCNGGLSILLVTCAVGFNGICTSGYFVNLLDIAPRLAGSLVGVVNTATGIAGFTVPLVISVFTTNQADIEGWQKVFWIAAALNVFGAVVYCLIGSGEEEEWAKDPKTRRTSRET
ncbi:sialin-like [Diadema antillarum]|uniref:sialin-like n=1 Tax=Diadema antillarum TaxID=105358 RepID=UPI003A83EF3E